MNKVPWMNKVLGIRNTLFRPGVGNPREGSSRGVAVHDIERWACVYKYIRAYVYIFVRIHTYIRVHIYHIKKPYGSKKARPLF